MRISDWSSDVCSSDLKEPLREPDLNDRASSETDWSIELRTRDRQRKLIEKIDAALRRIDDGEYGYCEVTGEPISLGRLEDRPIATMTVEEQARPERQERVFSDACVLTGVRKSVVLVQSVYGRGDSGGRGSIYTK